MTIEFYYGSGSPFAWYVWLVLEYKEIPYEFNLLSLQGKDLKDPGYLAIHPRGKVPAIVDGDAALRESAAIVEYLEERHPGIPVFPNLAQDRARVRSLVCEIHNYLYPPSRQLLEMAMGRRTYDAGVMDEVVRELDYFEGELSRPFLGEALSAADFALYPLLAIVDRMGRRYFQQGVTLGPKTMEFMRKIEALSCFEKTYPPHWKG